MKIRFYASTGYVGCAREEILDSVKDLRMDEGEWEGLDEASKEEIFNTWLWENIEASYTEIEED